MSDIVPLYLAIISELEGFINAFVVDCSNTNPGIIKTAYGTPLSSVILVPKAPPNTAKYIKAITTGEPTVGPQTFKNREVSFQVRVSRRIEFIIARLVFSENSEIRVLFLKFS